MLGPLGLSAGQEPPQHQRGQDGGRRRDDVHGPPAGGLGDPAGHRSSQQDAQQKTTHDAADHPTSAFARARLAANGMRSCATQAVTPMVSEATRRRRSSTTRGRGARAGTGQQEGDDEAAVLEEVAERDDEEDADRVAELAGGDQQGRRAPADMEVGGQQVEQRLRVEMVATARPHATAIAAVTADSERSDGTSIAVRGDALERGAGRLDIVVVVVDVEGQAGSRRPASRP